MYMMIACVIFKLYWILWHTNLNVWKTQCCKVFLMVRTLQISTLQINTEDELTYHQQWKYFSSTTKTSANLYPIQLKCASGSVRKDYNTLSVCTFWAEIHKNKVLFQLECKSGEITLENFTATEKSHPFSDVYGAAADMSSTCQTPVYTWYIFT